MFDYIKMPFFEEEGGGGSASSAAAGAEVATTITADIVKVQTGEKTGEADLIPDGSKPNAAWMEMRKKAKEADDLRKKVDEYEPKIKTAEELEKKMKKLEKALPEGFATLDDFLSTLEDDYQPPKQKPAIDENAISSLVKKAIEEHPSVKATKGIVERDEKRKADEYVVNNFKSLQKEFPDIKEIKDVPVDVLEAWMSSEVDNKNFKRTLTSYYYELKGKDLIEKAKLQGAGQEKIKDASTSHTSKVQGPGPVSELDSVTVPPEVQKLYQGMKIPQDKWKQHYVKYLKSRGG